MVPDRSDELLEALARSLAERGWMIATAESCTGGWVAKRCTDRAGSSAWFERGYVTYSNRAKSEMLGVDPQLIERDGAVSQAVACQMAEGALRAASVEVAVAITGIAGPEGGSADKPVGTVWFGWARAGRTTVTELRQFTGDREAVRRQSVSVAIEGLVRITGAR